MRAAGSSFESAQIENDLAMAYLATGNVARARELAGEARREFEEAGDQRYLSAVPDTEARVALASAKRPRRSRWRRAASLAEQSGNQVVQLAAMLTEARALHASGDAKKAEGQYAAAAAMARAGQSPSRLREVLREVGAARRERRPSWCLRAHPRGARGQLTPVWSVN